MKWKCWWKILTSIVLILWMCGHHCHATIWVLNVEIVTASVIVVRYIILDIVIIKNDRLSWHIAVRLKSSWPITMTDLVLFSSFFSGSFTLFTAVFDDVIDKGEETESSYDSANYYRNINTTSIVVTSITIAISIATRATPATTATPTSTSASKTSSADKVVSWVPIQQTFYVVVVIINTILIWFTCVELIIIAAAEGWLILFTV